MDSAKISVEHDQEKTASSGQKQPESHRKTLFSPLDAGAVSRSGWKKQMSNIANEGLAVRICPSIPILYT